MRSRLLTLLTVMAAACGERTGVAEQEGVTYDASDFAEWDASEDLRIGVVDGAPEYQLHNVVGAQRLPDGRIAVMNAGSHQLRIYDAAGRHLTASGREGAGPGEFRFPVELKRSGDTLLVFDRSARRISLHALDASHIGERPIPENIGHFAGNIWLHDRSWIDGPSNAVGRAQVRAAIERLPLPDTITGMRHVLVTPHGHLWVRGADVNGTREWRIHDIDATPVARVALPADMRIYEIGPDYILGAVTDSFEVQYVTRLRLTPGAPQRQFAFTASPEDTVIPETQDTVQARRRKDLQSAIRQVAAAQEIHYSTPSSSYTYASALKDLTVPELPPDITIEVMRASQVGWTAIAVDRITGLMCGIGVQWEIPIGWAPGVPTCDRRVPDDPR